MSTEVVIPTIKDEVRTLESLPEDVTVWTQRESPVTRARNIGADRVSSDKILFLDDDIYFEESDFWDWVDRIDRNTIVGLRDWDFDLIATRVMGVHSEVWRDLGGFDTRIGSHMEDTEISLRALRKGYELDLIDQSRVGHYEHERSVTTWDRAWRLAYLCGKYPRKAPILVRGIL